MHKRWRRRLLTIAACVVAGAVVTVAVTWGFSKFGEWQVQYGENSQSRPMNRWPRRVPDSWPPPSDLTWCGGLAWRSEYYVGFQDDRQSGLRARRMLVLGSCGWPMLALEARSRTGPDPAKPLTTGAIWLKDMRFLPLIPVWPGFAIDTAFYGTLAFLFWTTPGFIRRRSRRRRGQCPACGYSRSGLPCGVPCPECGAGKGPTA